MRSISTICLTNLASYMFHRVTSKTSSSRDEIRGDGALFRYRRKPSLLSASAVPIPCGACGGAQQNGMWPVSATCKHAAILAGCAGLTQSPVRNRTAGTPLVLHMVIRRVGIELAWALSQPERGDIELEPSIQDIR